MNAGIEEAHIGKFNSFYIALMLKIGEVMNIICIDKVVVYPF